MRFAVTRTSGHDREAKPCEEATRGELDYWDVRTFKSPEEHDATPWARHSKWRDRGTDHQFVYGPGGDVAGIKRNLGPRTAWFVDLASLEELVAFHEKYGELVLTNVNGNDSVPGIEIYDGYRE